MVRDGSSLWQELVCPTLDGWISERFAGQCHCQKVAQSPLGEGARRYS